MTRSADQLRETLAVPDVGHGTSVVVFYGDDVAVFDTGPGSALLEFLEQQRVSRIRAVIHPDLMQDAMRIVTHPNDEVAKGVGLDLTIPVRRGRVVVEYAAGSTIDVLVVDEHRQAFRHKKKPASSGHVDTDGGEVGALATGGTMWHPLARTR